LPLRKCSSEDTDILPLLCDLLPGGTGLLVMLKVFLDKGEKRDLLRNDGDQVLSVAAVVFKPNPYKQFVRPWNRMLKAWNASAFRATDFYNGAEEFERKESGRESLFRNDCPRIPAMIGGHIHRVSVVAFRPNEFADKASVKWKARFGVGTHAIAVQLCMMSLGWWSQDNCPSETFAYFHESGDIEESRVSESVEKMRANKEYAAVMKAKSFSMVDKGVARGLEAADFVAWHWNKHYIDKLKSGDEIPRKDFAAFMSMSDKKVSSAFVTGEKLTEFFRVCDQL